MGEVYNATEIKIDRNFRLFIDFMSLELEVPTVCLVTGGVSGRRDRRYPSRDVLGGKHEEWYRCLEPGLIIDRVDTSTVSVDKGLIFDRNERNDCDGHRWHGIAQTWYDVC